ncbi:MAG: MotA/TolQ/ExbB proton channel family protein [Phycisphaerales bacterium]
MTFHGLHTLAQDAAETTGGGGMSALEFLGAGGVIGYIIMALSFVAVALIIVHLAQIRRSALAPPELIERLDELLSRGRVDEAMRACEESPDRSFLAIVVGAGLSRYRRSPFGALELKQALEEAGQDRVARLYRSTDALALVANIAPMLGLLGTVVGINGAFASMNTAEGFARPDQLAGDISLALVTTIMGLSLAIPTQAVVTFFRNRIDALASDVGTVIDTLASHLERGSGTQPAPVGAPSAPRPPAPGASG